MLEVREIIYQWQQGKGERAISRSLGTSRNTIRTLTDKARRLGLKRESGSEEAEKVIVCLLAAKKERHAPCPSQNYLSQFHEQIAAWREAPHMTTIQIMRLLKEQGKKVSETTLRRYMQAHFADLLRTASTVHLEVDPGSQAQVDFGYAGLMKDTLTGKMRKTNAFIMTLAYSRYRFVRFVFRQDIKTWVDCHIRAFHFYGGVPLSVLLDNLKSGVIKPDIYDPTINRIYAELERHYCFIADPAKVRIARHKGRVERSVIIVRQQILAGRDFKDIDEANEHALKWCRHENAYAVTRTTGKTPWEMFEGKEKACLKPLPVEDYECPVWQAAKVHKDQHIIFEGSFYSVPSTYVGQEVWVRAGLRMVEIFAGQTCIKKHIRAKSKGKWVTDNTDYPKGARAFMEKGIAECLEEAQGIGVSVHTLLSEFKDSPSLTHRRKAQAILRLADTYSPSRLEAACRRALTFGNVTYKCLQDILKKKLDQDDLVQEEESHQSKTQLQNSSYLRNVEEFSSPQMEVCT